MYFLTTHFFTASGSSSTVTIDSGAGSSVKSDKKFNNTFISECVKRSVTFLDDVDAGKSPISIKQNSMLKLKI